MNETSKIIKADSPLLNFTRPIGEEAFCKPDSMQWRVFKNNFVFVIGAISAVLLEFADARIRSGVWDHSIYKVDPIGRSRRTGMATMFGVYGAKSVTRQMVAGVTRMHGSVTGKTPSGEDYRALDPELLNWVYATAQYGFINAYDRFVSKLTDAEIRQFWLEGRPIAELYGVTELPTSNEEFLAMMDKLAPRFEPHAINLEFLEIIESGKARPQIPKFMHHSLARAGVSLLPPIVRQKLELGKEWDMTFRDKIVVSAVAKLADRIRDKNSAAWQAAERLGLPGDTAWRIGK